MRRCARSSLAYGRRARLRSENAANPASPMPVAPPRGKAYAETPVRSRAAPGPPANPLVAIARHGALAQLAEHWLCKPGVRGSNPLGSTDLDHRYTPYAP